MKTHQTAPIAAAIIVALLSAGALAAKPDSPGQGKGKGHAESSEAKDNAQKGKNDPGRDFGQAPESPSGKSKLVAKKGVHFEDRHRSVLREWLRQEYNSGSCPPGLAKKRNGCMPPGQAKKWQIGRTLPRDVIYYSLPAAILRELGRAPEGHKYVRVGADILLLALGTSMVVDAVEDLSDL